MQQDSDFSLSNADIGRCIAQRRKQLGFTQAQLAERLGLATITVRQYEAGKRGLKLDRLNQIAYALDCPDAWALLDVAYEEMQPIEQGRAEVSPAVQSSPVSVHPSTSANDSSEKKENHTEDSVKGEKRTPTDLDPRAAVYELMALYKFLKTSADALERYLQETSQNPENPDDN